MRVIVTRPATQAADWVVQLRAHAIDAVALPLIGIAPVADPAALRVAWRGLARQRLVVFVSPNAAEQFFAQRPLDAPWPPALLAGSPGPGTTRVLLGLGVPAERVVAPAGDALQFDSESLWAQMRDRDWRGANVLIVRGDGGRDWLAQTLREAGAHVAHLAAYARAVPAFDAAESALLRAALARPAVHLWFFSSSEAIDNLAAIQDVGTDWAAAQAIATHPRIVARARQLGFARVTAARPSLPAVIACIQSIGS
ncbi:MAG TPA: uroporphyrinogen-III synthase [Burkholderiaceae bacterium]|nr:uroporphyrinogen-III synthase [Burkholderiaceae bacterium]